MVWQMGCLLYLWNLGSVNRTESGRRSSSHPAVQKACRFLKQIQLEDGSFGESCKSAELKTYVPLPFGTVVQTAWATEALLNMRKQITQPF